AALDARASGDRGRGLGGRGELQVPVADRGSTLGNQERLPGGEFAAGDMGRTGKGCDSQRGSGGADRVPAGPGAGDTRGTGDGGFERHEVEVLVCRFGKGMKPSELT